MPSHRSIVIFSGGTAANYLVDIFESIRKSKDCPISYIIPISDNGGSSSELIRVFGGPGIGDVRSRLVRLIPRLPEGSPGFKEREAIRALFNHRLSSKDSRTAKIQWGGIVDGTSELWRDVSSAKKELIRPFLILVNSEITKRSRPPSSTFDFTSASVGNLFITGARLFSGSFESAIYLLGSICGIGDENVKVIPSVNSNFSHHIAAGLEDGSVIVGQNAISHPSPTVIGSSVAGTANPSKSPLVSPSERSTQRQSSVEHYDGIEKEMEDEQNEEEDANLPGTLALLRAKNITFNKDAHLNEDLPARISRIWYINPYGQEILPPANPRAIQAINHAQAIIYSIGSLYTSLIPSIILRGVGDALRRNTPARGTGLRTKIFILNGSLDREVGPQPPHEGAQGNVFSAVDFVEAIIRAGEQSRGASWEGDALQADTSSVNTPDILNTGGRSTPTEFSAADGQASRNKVRPSLFSSKSESLIRTTLKSPHASTTHRSKQLFPPPLPASTATSREPSPSPTPPETTDNGTNPKSTSTFDGTLALNIRISRPSTPTTSTKPSHLAKHYITHLIHLPNHASTPHVDKDLLQTRYGIQCVTVYGRSAGEGQGMRYDHDALRRAIEAILGSRAEREVGVDSGRDEKLGGWEDRKQRSGERGRTGADGDWDWRRGVASRRNTVDG